MNRRALLQWGIAETGSKKRLEAELLLCYVLGTSRALLLAHDDMEATEVQIEAYQGMIMQYQSGAPLQYLLGKTDFMGLELQVTPAVLIPRFDTECLVERALQLLEPILQPTVLDICTGSGAIAIAISHYKKDTVVYAGDLSAEALCVAMQNNAQCGTTVQFRQGNLLEPFSDLQGKVDLLISNPPYVTTEEMQALPEDVRQEPRMALWGGEDGLYFYRKITAAAVTQLHSGGWLAFEVGWQQGDAVRQLLTSHGFGDVKILQDWQGLDRVFCGRKIK